MPEKDTRVIALQAPNYALALIRIDAKDFGKYDCEAFNDAYLAAYEAWLDACDEDAYAENRGFEDTIATALRAAGYDFESIEFGPVVIIDESEDEE